MTWRVVVDGSNLATEGRSLPSLEQLDQAVRAFQAEHTDDDIVVVVDASFGYRIDDKERPAYEEAEAAGEIVSPPAGAIGRGDGFVLQIADRVGATVLSNDSFQEFHGTYGWLFDEGRLIGGKPVAGVGWIFTARSPVRGPTSRKAVQAARRAKKAGADDEVADAIADAKADAVSGSSGSSRRRRRGRPPSAPVNDPLPFIEFIAEHKLGSEVEGKVVSFSSHGAFVTVDGTRCYAPLTALGDPPPRSAKDVLKKDEVRTFVLQALDPPRRGIELALPGLARVAGAPTEETVEAEIEAEAPVKKKAVKKRAPAKKKAPAKRKAAGTARKSPAKKASAGSKKAGAKKAAAATTTAAAKNSTQRSGAKKGAAKKAAKADKRSGA